MALGLIEALEVEHPGRWNCGDRKWKQVLAMAIDAKGVFSEFIEAGFTGQFGPEDGGDFIGERLRLFLRFVPGKGFILAQGNKSRSRQDRDRQKDEHALPEETLWRMAGCCHQLGASAIS